MKLIGIDRGRKVWLVAESDERFQDLTLGISEDLTDYLESLDGENCRVVIDVPIGLPDSAPRIVDQVARKLVGGKRASSIFPVPVRTSLDGGTYEEASALNHQASGKKLSAQAYGILDGIRDLDAFMTPDRQEWLREGHPEVTFAVLSGGAGMEDRKKTPAGVAARSAVLAQHLTVPDIVAARLELGRKYVGPDDVLDALAMLVSAGRLIRGIATILPDGQIERDSRGLKMEMVA
ncbi:MAG: DUF429 domain-containing protein [Thermomicrobiales bacterium]